jgi:Ca2+-binding RTX toxin-like protein
MKSVPLVTFVVLAGLMIHGIPAASASRPVIRGTTQSDDVVGTPLGDRIYGLAGNDHIEGRGGSDVIFGGPGDDTLVGGGSKDYLAGDEDDDTLVVRWANGRPADFASCGFGDDILILQGVPEADRRGIEQEYGGAPNACESVRFR